MMESVLEVLHNFYLVCQWHRKPFEEESYDLDQLHQKNVMENEEEEIGKENEKDLTSFAMADKEGVSGTTLLMVRRQLRVSRRVRMTKLIDPKSIWQHSQRLINDFINCSKLDNSNTHLVKQILVNDLCMYFMKV